MTTVVDFAGQFVTVAAQDVVVYVLVVYTVEVVSETEEPPEVEEPAVAVLLEYILLLVGSVVTEVVELELEPPDPLPQARSLNRVAVSKTVPFALLMKSWVK